jgi:hypothetical protein
MSRMFLIFYFRVSFETSCNQEILEESRTLWNERIIWNITIFPPFGNAEQQKYRNRLKVLLRYCSVYWDKCYYLMRYVAYLPKVDLCVLLPFYVSSPIAARQRGLFFDKLRDRLLQCRRSDWTEQLITSSAQTETDYCQNQSQSYFTVGCLPPISSSWCQAPWDSRPENIFFNWTFAVIVLM